MLCLYFVKTVSDARGIIADRHPEAVEVPLLTDDDWPLSNEEAEFVESMGIGVQRQFHLRNQGAGVQRLVRIFSAWRRAPEALHYVFWPEASLHPSVQPLLAEWMTRNGRWVAETASEMFALRLARLGSDSFDIYVVSNEGGSAVDELQAASTGLPVVQHMRMGPDGEFLTSWPGGFFQEREKELF